MNSPDQDFSSRTDAVPDVRDINAGANIFLTHSDGRVICWPCIFMTCWEWSPIAGGEQLKITFQAHEAIIVGRSLRSLFPALESGYGMHLVEQGVRHEALHQGDGAYVRSLSVKERE